jgi:hypothetical protein
MGEHNAIHKDVFWRRYQKYKLHPLHFTELSAAFFYSASLVNRVPKFMMFEAVPIQVVQSPLQGLSSKPIFDDWEQEKFAGLLSRMIGLPFEQVFSPAKGVASWLHDARGRIRLLPVRGADSGRFA